MDCSMPGLPAPHHLPWFAQVHVHWVSDGLSFYMYGVILLPCWLRWWRICLKCRRPTFHPWVRKIPLEEEMSANSIFLPGESHKQRSLEGYSPWGRRELDLSERLTLWFCFSGWNLTHTPSRVDECDGYTVKGILFSFIPGNVYFMVTEY